MEGRSTNSTGESVSAESKAPRRSFDDTSGQHWTAFECPLPAADWTSADEEAARAGYGAGWLCFESGEEHSRVRLYPLHWPRISDEALEELRARARRMPT